MFTGSEQLSKQANIKYTHITLGAGVDMQWNQPENWSKVICKFRKHSCCYDFFDAVGSYISGRVLEELYVN